MKTALVIGARDDDFLPYSAHAGKYLRTLGAATGYQLTDTSGRFIFPDECDVDIDVFGVSLCKDRPGADRQADLQEADEETRAKVVAAVRPAFDPFVSGGEVRFTAACWMASAKAPDAN